MKCSLQSRCFHPSGTNWFLNFLDMCAWHTFEVKNILMSRKEDFIHSGDSYFEVIYEVYIFGMRERR